MTVFFIHHIPEYMTDNKPGTKMVEWTEENTDESDHVGPFDENVNSELIIKEEGAETEVEMKKGNKSKGNIFRFLFRRNIGL